jgi:hypothetical protein
MNTSAPLAVLGTPLAAVLVVLTASIFAAGCRSNGGSEYAPTPTLTTDTLRARNIELVDEKGRVRLFMSGQRDNWGPTIVFRDEDADDKDVVEDGLLMLSLTKTGPKGDGPTVAIIHAESGKFGNMNIAIDPDSAQLALGSDETDQFQITCDKDGLTVSVLPKGALPVVLIDSVQVQPSVPKEPRGLRITLDRGRIVVHDLAGHEIGALADPAATPTAK